MEKLRKLLKMTEHPEHYTDEEWQEIFDGDTVSQEQTDAAWQQFESTHYGSGTDKTQPLLHPAGKAPRSSFYKMAASFIGILLVSGIAVAAILQARHAEPSAPATAQVSGVVADDKDEPSPAGRQAPRTIVFEESELQQIVDSLSAYYQVKAGYHRDAARHLRLYYEWDQRNSLGEIIEMLNQFEQVSLSLKGDSIIIK